MRSRNSAHLAAAILIALLTTAVAAQETAPPPAFSRTEIAAAVTTVKKDPNLGAERTIKMLRWNQTNRSESFIP